jgi:hypothetical protein
MWYRVPQYGHIASPVAATSRKTRGWLDHSGIAGFGQYSGRSAAVTSTAFWVGLVAVTRLSSDGGKPGSILGVLSQHGIEE